MTKIFLLLVIGLLPLVAFAQDDSAEKVASVEGVTEYRLANGGARASVPGVIQTDGHNQHDGFGRIAS